MNRLLFRLRSWSWLLFILPAALAAADRPTILLDAPERGVFNIGPSKGQFTQVPDESLKRNVVRLNYDVPIDTVVGLWSKGYPAAVGPATVSTIKVHVFSPPDQLRQVTVLCEIKGDKDVQRIPVPLQPGWAAVEAPLEWGRIGNLKEAVFVVTPVGEGRRGHVLLDLEFLRPSEASGASGPWGVASAKAKGVFTMGASDGKIQVVSDPVLQRDILKFDFSAPLGATVGVWTKQYPAALGPTTATGFRVAVKGTDPVQTNQLRLTLELKGSKDTQRLSVPVQPTWTPIAHRIEWDRIGDLREAVFVLAPVGGPHKGTVYADLEFVKLAGLKNPAPGTLSINDAGSSGPFNIGAAQTVLSSLYDESLGKEVVTLTYGAPATSVVGLWTKEYPARLSAANFNGVTARVRVPRSVRSSVAVSLEIKGSKKEVQRVPLPLQPGWNTVRIPLEWETFGSLKEAVFVVRPAVKKGDLSGTLAFDLEFFKGDFAKPSPVPPEQPVASPLGQPLLLETPSPTVNITQAKSRGAFNIGPSEGVIQNVVDQTANKEVLQFTYRVPSGSVVGVWTKDYPTYLNRESVNGIQATVTLPETVSPSDIQLTLELKGKKVQVIALPLSDGRSVHREGLDWDLLGELKEAVFVLKPEGGKRQGTLTLDLDFIKGTFPRKPRSLSGAERVLMVLAAGFLLGLLSGAGRRLWQALFKRRHEVDPLLAGPERETPLSRLRMDVLIGLATALLVAAALGIYVFATAPQIRIPHMGLLLGLAGVLIAELYKVTLTRTHLTGREIFQNFFLTGLLAATASTQALWQAPGTWTQLLMKSSITGALACVVYHLVNAGRLASTGKSLGPIGGGLIVGTPFLFGWLLILSDANMLARLTAPFLAGDWTAWPETSALLGRFLVLLVFNELAVNGISLATKGKLLKGLRGHAWLALVSLAVVLAPTVADLGSSARVASLPLSLRVSSAILSAMVSQAGLWMEAYLITGMILDGIHGYMPSADGVLRHAKIGLRKGAAYSGIFLGFLYGIKLLVDSGAAQALMRTSPILVGVAAGGLIFPLIKTIIESFDGSMSFFLRARYSYKQPILYARGAVAGAAVAFGFTSGVIQNPTPDRLLYGLLAGITVGGGVSVLRDMANALRFKGRIQRLRVYVVDSLIGGLIGALLAFYLDGAQIPVIVQKFRAYTSAGLEPVNFTVYSLLSKWGRVDLGMYTGGSRLLFDEALAGLITWTIAAPLFAINRVFMTAYFQRDRAPIRHFFSKAGAVELVANLIHVMRWGLWMSPIISTGLRVMGEATWYNQDGALRTVVAIFKNFTLSPADFQTWSLTVFISLLAYDLVRVLIWVDHMGLRVATLVNLSFLGMDKLDEKVARWIGPSAAQRYMPEGVKRFTTWAPLLIPFYLPRGDNWDLAWHRSQEIQSAAAGMGLTKMILAMEWHQLLGLFSAGVLLMSALTAILRAFLQRGSRRRAADVSLANREYKVVVSDTGAFHSEILRNGYDLTRRSYDLLDPAGRTLFLVEDGQGAQARPWPVLGNFPQDLFTASKVERGADSLWIVNTANGLRTTVQVTLPDADAAVELWTVTLDNHGNAVTDLKVAPYLEWVLDRPESDRGHTQYGRLFPEMEYVATANAVLVSQRKTKSFGFLASDLLPEGFHTSRMDFIGRARSLWSPRIMETFDFLEARDTAPYPTFDPIGSLLLGIRVEPKATREVKFLLGSAKDRDAALNLIQRLLKPQAGKPFVDKRKKKRGKTPLISHGEIPPETPLPYSIYKDRGNTLTVHTPFTPRPYDHALSNAVGHYVMVTNRGLHSTANGNSQQNPVTPDWPDTVTREVPSEAIYLYDPDREEWFSPTHHPLNDPDAKHECSFGVDGTAVFRMSRESLSTDLTVFVPPDEPVGVYLLTVRNKSDQARRLRVSPYFQIALAGAASPRPSLQIRHSKSLNALFFQNPVNAFHRGPAFASMSLASDCVETKRGRYLGGHRGVAHPYLVEKGAPDQSNQMDDRAIAGFLGTIELPPQGERTIVFLLGQTVGVPTANAIIQKYKSVDAAKVSLIETRRWWLDLMSTVEVETNQPEFDQFQNWLKYQAVAERLWARRGFYQTSGAFGFRDQLQDSVNLIWVDPALARKQILLHASQQFVEGDVVHWFHTLQDGRSAFSNRSHASDNLLWLAWGVAEYVRMTGDESLLKEKTTYLKSETPFEPLPKNKHGWGTNYLRSALEDTVYRHCMKAIDLVLERRMGQHGLPLIGTGDWNDGLDEIGSLGRGESVWLGFFLYYILKNMADVIEKVEGRERKEHYLTRLHELEAALEHTWREDRYLRAIHDDGTEIGVKDSGVWEIDALTAAWAVYAGINPQRNQIVFQTALDVLEKDNVVLLGWPALREDTKPFLGRSSHYPEGVRENGMYCHGVQWLIRAARLLAERAEQNKEKGRAKEYRQAAFRLWMKITPLAHLSPSEIENYGGQPNKQPADLLTTFDPGRMIWHGYTGAAGWLLRQALEGVVGAQLVNNQVVMPTDVDLPRGPLEVTGVKRDLSESPFHQPRPPQPKG